MAGKGPGTRCLTFGVLCAAVLAIPAGGLDAAETTEPAQRALARRILDTTGVQGGLIVHLGCGDGKLTAALGARDGYLVHGLDCDADKVNRARQHVQALRLSALSNGPLYGKVSIEQWTGRHLPYADNLVNLIVMRDSGYEIRDEEIMRVLVPGGGVGSGKDRVGR